LRENGLTTDDTEGTDDIGISGPSVVKWISPNQTGNCIMGFLRAPSRDFAGNATPKTGKRRTLLPGAFNPLK
jgi:hypothetical protein